jgi:hypothetical protein
MKAAQGHLRIEKGNLEPGSDEIQLYQWDAVGECLNMNCNIVHLCNYDKNGKCKAELKYLGSVNHMIFKNFSEVLDEPTLFRVGRHLMPLYKHLCKMKMYELQVTDVIWEDENGKLKAEPIYKEIRDTIKAIEAVWKSTGLSKFEIELDSPELEMGGRKYETMGDIPIDGEPEPEKGKRRKIIRRKK